MLIMNGFKSMNVTNIRPFRQKKNLKSIFFFVEILLVHASRKARWNKQTNKKEIYQSIVNETIIKNRTKSIRLNCESIK